MENPLPETVHITLSRPKWLVVLSALRGYAIPGEIQSSLAQQVEKAVQIVTTDIEKQLSDSKKE